MRDMSSLKNLIVMIDNPAITMSTGRKTSQTKLFGSLLKTLALFNMRAKMCCLNRRQKLVILTVLRSKSSTFISI